MDVVYAIGRATAADIQERLPDSPSYSTVRTLLRVLEQKGHLRHTEEGLRYVYLPTVPRTEATKSALQRLVHTFFDGSARKAVAALLDPGNFQLSPDELEQLSALVEKAKQEEEKKKP